LFTWVSENPGAPVPTRVVTVPAAEAGGVMLEANSSPVMPSVERALIFLMFLDITSFLASPF
jgi:hypothetical protein